MPTNRASQQPKAGTRYERRHGAAPPARRTGSVPSSPTPLGCSRNHKRILREGEPGSILMKRQIATSTGDLNAFLIAVKWLKPRSRGTGLTGVKRLSSHYK